MQYNLPNTGGKASCEKQKSRSMLLRKCKNQN